jgi:hypothetical protein
VRITGLDAVSMVNNQKIEFQEIETIFYKNCQKLEIEILQEIKRIQAFDLLKNLEVTSSIVRSKLFLSHLRLLIPEK